MADVFTEEFTTLCHEAFMLYDQVGDGFVQISDVAMIMENLGQSITEKHLEEIKAELDNGNGEFDLNAFLTVIAKLLCDTDNEDELRNAFHVFDHKEDGTLLASELKHNLITRADKLLEKEANELLRQTYIDDDGDLKYEELVRLLISESSPFKPVKPCKVCSKHGIDL